MEVSLKDLGSLVASDNIFEMMEWVVKIASDISKCGRVCFIAKEGEEFYVRSGIPENGHGIGKEISLEYGRNFLEQVMDKKKILVISNPKRDARLSYMRDLIAKYDISAVLFIPIVCENRDIGILIADAVCMQNNFNLKQIKEVVLFFSTVIGKELENQEKQEKVLQAVKHSESLAALGEHVATIAHTFRNKLQIYGGFPEQIVESLEKDFSIIPEEVKKEKIISKLRRSAKASQELETFVSEILKFCQTTDCMFFEKTNINEFMKEMVEALNLKKKNIGVVYEFEKHLDQKLVSFDQRHFSVCIHDVIKNAMDAEATRIFIKTRLHPERNLFRVIIGNNGKSIPVDDLKNIFSPFFTTKPTGTGLGLAIVSKLIAAHGGRIEARSDNTKGNKQFGTFFEISMPLNR